MTVGSPLEPSEPETPSYPEGSTGPPSADAPALEAQPGPEQEAALGPVTDSVPQDPDVPPAEDRERDAEQGAAEDTGADAIAAPDASTAPIEEVVPEQPSVPVVDAPVVDAPVAEAPVVGAPVGATPVAPEAGPAAVVPQEQHSSGASDSGTTPGARPRRRLRVLAAVVAALVVAGAGLLVWSPWSGLPDDAAFRAAGTVVTETEVQRRTDVLAALYGVQVPEDPDRLDQFRRDTAKALAISLVLDRAARDEGIRTADKTVSDALDRFLAQRYPEGGRAAYVRALTAQGVGEQDVLDEIRRQLEIRELFDRTTQEVEVSDGELEALFRAAPAQYATPERRQLRHIVVSDMASAQAVLRRLEAGQDFAAVAAQTSLDGSTKARGGDLGLLAATELEPSFAEVAFAVAPAARFGPVQTSLGWHVGRVDRVVPGSPTTFEQVRDQLREQQETERAVALWRDFVLERLDAADVAYAPDYRPDDPRPDLDGGPLTPEAPSPSRSTP